MVGPVSGNSQIPPNEVTDYNNAVTAYQSAVSAKNPSAAAKLMQTAISDLTAACGGNPNGACANWIDQAQNAGGNQQALANIGKPPLPWGG